MNNKKQIVAIVEARMTSSRLPGKHLLEAMGKPMLQHLVDRLKIVKSIDTIVIATTTNSTDDILVNFAHQNKVNVFRGSEDDVMGRVLGAAIEFNADVVCEVTGDCPIIDPELVDHIIQTYLHNTAVYVNNGKLGLPDGMGAQVFSISALSDSESQTNEPLDREHVTLHIKRNPDLFPAIYMIAPKSIHWPELAITLDEKQDYELLKNIIEHFGNHNPMFDCYDVIQLLKERPEWVEMSQSVLRKGAT